ncbi:VWA domain-containing protein [Ferrimonas balearica]|nr:VWA domain-containing protein [Ferrimonas balearica]
MFDITISLEENPQGDDDYAVDSGTGDDEQNAFEERIEEFARAVFQSTNGAHRIGKVTIFRDGASEDSADVRWEENCPSANSGPYAHVNGFLRSGARIRMCTNWAGAPSLMPTAKGSGYTLAHEWAHYAYGLFDEYVGSCGQSTLDVCSAMTPQFGDTPADPSIMNWQWGAALGGPDAANWLEFSTFGVEPYATDRSGNDENAQARMYGEPGWDTLVRDSATDPKFSTLSSRSYYADLVAPTSTDLLVNNDETPALGAPLEIVWAGSQAVGLMIDSSGSMIGTKVANAKAAASLLVGELVPGQTAIGVGEFDGYPSEIYPITDIPDPDTGVRSAAQAAIAGINAGGGTDIEAAALLGLEAIQNFDGGSRPSVAYLLTDGQSYVDQARVIDAYVAADVPLITFGFGSDVDDVLLKALADGTGGEYFFSPTTLADIQQAFAAANAAFSSSVLVSSGTVSAASSATEVRDVVIDSTLSLATITVIYDLDESDIALALLDESGNDSGIDFTCSADAEVSCVAEVDVAADGAGTYGVEIANTTGSEKDVSVLVSGAPAGFDNYDVAVEFDDTNYPYSFAISATVSYGLPLTGVDVVATVTLPDGSELDLTLLDDGRNSDVAADDGIYTVDVPYDADGTYSVVVTATNSSGNAQTTYNGIAISVPEDRDAEIETPVPSSVPEDFTRLALVSADVSGVEEDDHPDSLMETPMGCTILNDDNVDVVGRIDDAGDVDCFTMIPSDTSTDLVVRVTGLYADMEPVLEVYDASMSNVLLSADLSTSENPASGVILTIPAASLDASGHVVSVSHEDPGATSGGYAVSAGAALVSDEEDEPREPGDQGGGSDGSSGGAVGPWGLLVIGLLALVGLLRRRRAMH